MHIYAVLVSLIIIMIMYLKVPYHATRCDECEWPLQAVLKIGHFLCFNDIPVGRGHIDSVTDR